MKKILSIISIFIILTVFMTGCGKAEKMITGVDDLQKAKIGVMTGTTGEIIAREKFPDADIKSFDDVMDAIAALKSGQIEAVITAYPTTLNTVRHNPDLGYLKEALSYEDTSIAVRKEDKELLNQLNEIISRFRQDGTLEDIDRRWIKSDLSPYEQVEITVPPEGKVIKVGVAATREPFSFVDDKQQVTGHDAELAKRIASELGRPLEFVDMKFSALIPALQSGKIDMIISCMSATEERRKSVSFTEPYYKNAQTIMVRNIEDAEPGISFLQGIKESFNNNIILENRYLLIINGLKTTIIISLLAVVFGTLLGGLICFMRMSRLRILSSIARVYISILRGVPVLVLLMLIFYVAFASVDISPILVAVIAFGLNFAAYVAEMYRSGIESVDKGQTEAGIAMGFTKSKTFFYIVLPQAVRHILPVYKGEFISLLKMTSVVGYIAVEDLTKASDIIRSRTFDAFFPLVMAAILYFVIAWLLLLGIGCIERYFDPKAQKRQVKKA